jgi:hypothetical protein
MTSSAASSPRWKKSAVQDPDLTAAFRAAQLAHVVPTNPAPGWANRFLTVNGYRLGEVKRRLLWKMRSV